MSQAQPARTVAERIIESAAEYKFWTMLIGYLASFCLIAGGIWFTQRDTNITHLEKSPSELSAKMGQFEFVAKSTAPGIVLILCGTWIVVTTTQRKSYAKTQWADEKNPGFTEING